MGIQFSDWEENIVGKGEIARYEQFSFSYYVFKRCLLLMREIEYLWSKRLKCQTNQGEISLGRWIKMKLQLHGWFVYSM